MLYFYSGTLATMFATMVTFCDEAWSSQFPTLSVTSTNTGQPYQSPQKGSAVVCDRGKGQSLVYKNIQEVSKSTLM